jgi:hypothetical protein
LHLQAGDVSTLMAFEVGAELGWAGPKKGGHPVDIGEESVALEEQGRGIDL